MLLIIGTVRLPPDRLNNARAAMEQMILVSRAEPGCLEYSYAEDVLDPGLIHVTERWVDRDSLDRHFASPHITIWRATWPSLGIGERDLVLYDVSNGQPR